jgi:hypothetical protein
MAPHDASEQLRRLDRDAPEDPEVTDRVAGRWQIPVPEDVDPRDAYDAVSALPGVIALTFDQEARTLTVAGREELLSDAELEEAVRAPDPREAPTRGDGDVEGVAPTRVGSNVPPTGEHEHG